MATGYRKSAGSTLAGYLGDVSTLSAIMGTVMAVAAAVQFKLLEINFLVVDYTIGGIDMILAGLVAYGLALFSSETKDPRQYTDGQKVWLAVGPGLMIAQEYLTEFSDLIAEYDPHGGAVAWVLIMVSWRIVSE